MILPVNFESDIQSKDTNLIPLVVFNDIPLHISTNNIYVDGQHFQPLLLNIPSIKQSVDIQNRKFKTSSVSLQISNYTYEGKRFSELLESTSLINQNVSIYWKSTTSTSIDSGEDTDCPLIYSGKIRRVSHDTEKVTVELEDLTEETVSKMIPSELVPDDELILERYRNKPIPMVYGMVDRSPIIINGGVTNYTGIIDSFELMGGIQTDYSVYGDLSGLYLYKDDKYLSVPHNVEKKMYYWENEGHVLAGNDWIGNAQWELFGHSIKFLQPPIIKEGFIQTITSFKPSVSFRIPVMNIYEYNNQNNYGLDDETEYIPGQTDGFYQEFLDPNEQNLVVNYDYENGLTRDFPTSIGEYLNVDTYAGTGGILTCKATLKIEATVASVTAKEQILLEMRMNGVHLPNYPQAAFADGGIDHDLLSQDGTPGSNFSYGLGSDPLFGDGEFEVNSSNTWDDALMADEIAHETLNYADFISSNHEAGSWHNEDAPLQVNDLWIGTTNFSTTEEGNIKQAPVVVFDREELTTGFKKIHLIHRIDLPNPSSSSASWDCGCTFRLDIKELDAKTAIDIEHPFNQNFFANVWGRSDPSVGILQKPAHIIKHILEEELGHDDFDDTDFNEALAHNASPCAFTVHDKQISAKDLIEDIAKSTQMYPYFGSDGTFRFNTMKSVYVHDDWLDATPITENEVISFSFLKTKPEQVYTKFNVKYNYDYGLKEFMSIHTSETNLSDEELPYYGYSSVEDNILDFESKYIRNSVSAGSLALWLRSFYMNAHLIIKLKLPIKHIGLSVGDKIKFDSLLGGVKAHGIDYVHDHYHLQQQIHPLFFITSVQKNIDTISIEAIQLHTTANEIGTLNPVDEEGSNPSPPYADIYVHDVVLTGEDSSGGANPDPQGWWHNSNGNLLGSVPWTNVKHIQIVEGVGDYFGLNAPGLTIGNSGAARQNLDALFDIQNWHLVDADGFEQTLGSWNDLATPEYDGTSWEFLVAIYLDGGLNGNYPNVFVALEGDTSNYVASGLNLSDNPNSFQGVNSSIDIDPDATFTLHSLHTFEDEDPDTYPTKISICVSPLIVANGMTLRWNPPLGLITEWRDYNDLGEEFITVYGCIDPEATNYNPFCNTDDGTCEYAPDYVPAPGSGDINWDEITDILDLVTMVDLIVNFGIENESDEVFAAGDINGDGVWNILDIVSLTQIILNED